MTLQAPSLIPALSLVDIEGQSVELRGQPLMLLSIFREANCPFCNFRVYELTQNYPDLVRRGLSIVAVFASSEEDVRKFIARRARPFRMVADPQCAAHSMVQGHRSMWGKLWAMLRRMPAMLMGMGMVGARGFNTGTLMPVDFLLDAQGRIIETYYGEDAGDHIPMALIEHYLALYQGEPAVIPDTIKRGAA